MDFLVDTNILLRILEPSDPEYAVIRSAIGFLLRRGDQLCYSGQNLIEFWNVCTRPRERNGFGLSIAETEMRTRILERRLRLLPDTPGIHQVWRRLVVEYSVAGVQVHDARLVALMLANGVSHLLTLNGRDFTRYGGISAVHPAAVEKGE